MLTSAPSRRRWAWPWTATGWPSARAWRCGNTTTSRPWRAARTVAYVKFEDALQEIFAVQVLPGVRHPDVINDQSRVIADSFVVPDEAMESVRGPLRRTARVTTEPSHTEEILR